MSNVELTNTITQALQALAVKNPAGAKAELEKALWKMQAEDEEFWNWCERQEAAHGPEMAWLAQEVSPEECPW